MAKKVRAIVKLQIPAGEATPAPPVGPALGQHGVNIMGFVKEYNSKTANQKGQHRAGGDHRVRGPLVHLRHQDIAGVGPAAQGGGPRARELGAPARAGWARSR